LTSRGWVRLPNFRLPFKHKIKLKMAGLAFGGKIKAGYKYGENSVLVYAEFNGDMLDRVLAEFMELVREWERQNYGE